MSLAELLVTVALIGVLGTATAQYFEHGQRVWAILAARAETQQSSRIALSRIVADVRTAGHGGATFDAVALAEPQRMVLQRDLNGDGAISAAGERVTWQLAAGILRREAGGGAQPIANGIRALQFRYVDAFGAATTVPADVRTVLVTLTTEPERSVVVGDTTTVSTLVRLRNR